jgi:hypothetical protein
MLVGAAPGAQRLSKVVVHTALLCKYKDTVKLIEQQGREKRNRWLVQTYKVMVGF